MLSLTWGVETREGIAFIDPKKCVGGGECLLTCSSGAIQIQWNKSVPISQKKMVEHTYGAIQKKKGKALCLNFLTQISPACDCYGYSDAPIVRDIGILSSEDSVAIDQTSVDSVNRKAGNLSFKLSEAWNPGKDKF
jgi:uncharacterized Fe-S center protein